MNIGLDKLTSDRQMLFFAFINRMSINDFADFEGDVAHHNTERLFVDEKMSHFEWLLLCESVYRSSSSTRIFVENVSFNVKSWKMNHDHLGFNKGSVYNESITHKCAADYLKRREVYGNSTDQLREFIINNKAIFVWPVWAKEIATNG